MEWQDIVKTVAPMLGTALGGPLVGTAVKVLGEAVLGRSDATAEEVQAAVESGMSPDVLVKLREMDNAFKVQMATADLNIKQLEVTREQNYLADVADARKAGTGNDHIFWLGVGVLITFAMATCLELYGAYKILSGTILINDVSVAAAVFGLLGNIIGYVAGNAQQVVGFFFGSSRGSDAKTNAMAAAMRDIVPNSAK